MPQQPASRSTTSASGIRRSSRRVGPMPTRERSWQWPCTKTVWGPGRNRSGERGLHPPLVVPASLAERTDSRNSSNVWQAAAPVSSTQRASSVPATRLARLRHGINASAWFAQVYDKRGYSKEHFQDWTTADDIALIKSMGFDHVRLSVNPQPMMPTLPLDHGCFDIQVSSSSPSVSGGPRMS